MGPLKVQSKLVVGGLAVDGLLEVVAARYGARVASFGFRKLGKVCIQVPKRGDRPVSCGVSEQLAVPLLDRW